MADYVYFRKGVTCDKPYLKREKKSRTCYNKRRTYEEIIDMKKCASVNMYRKKGEITNTHRCTRNLSIFTVVVQSGLLNYIYLFFCTWHFLYSMSFVVRVYYSV